MDVRHRARLPRVGRFLEWDEIAKCGSLKKAREWCANQNFTEKEIKERKFRKRCMRKKETELEREVQNLGVQNDMKTKRIKEMEQQLRVLQLAADPAMVKALQESVAAHAEAERKAYEKVDEAEALVRTQGFGRSSARAVSSARCGAWAARRRTARGQGAVGGR